MKIKNTDTAQIEMLLSTLRGLTENKNNEVRKNPYVLKEDTTYEN